MTPATLSLAYWDRKIGPFFDAPGVLAFAALTAEELALAVQYGDVLSMPTDGESGDLYPGFQFGSRGEFLPGLREVSAILAPAVQDDWDIALWLQTLAEEFHGRRPAEILRAGLVQPVMLAAKHAASTWTPTRGEPFDNGRVRTPESGR
ncbi:hypothetical protein ACLRGF_05455 [Mycetocola zhadangensis]|uniref:hypothetical protein n=1 Tax=Mycetocola zhadangensis TaxID=1164595 RepID=UPI003A4D9DDA